MCPKGSKIVPQGTTRDPKAVPVPPPKAAPVRPVAPRSDWEMPEEVCKESGLVLTTTLKATFASDRATVATFEGPKIRKEMHVRVGLVSATRRRNHIAPALQGERLGPILLICPGTPDPFNT